MLVQAAALALLALSNATIAIAATAAALLGLGTALVYPTLIAAISDAVTPIARAPIIGVYRFWRDMGYVLGALIAGAVADTLGYPSAIAIVAGLTAASGLWVLHDMPTRAPHTGRRTQRRPSSRGRATALACVPGPLLPRGRIASPAGGSQPLDAFRVARLAIQSPAEKGSADAQGRDRVIGRNRFPRRHGTSHQRADDRPGVRRGRR